MPPELAQLESAFAADFPIQRVPPTAEAPLGQLAVGLDPDESGRVRTLYVHLQPPSESGLFSLQLFALLPFPAPPQTSGELARFLLHVNRTLPLLGFGLSEPEGYVFFRTVLPVTPAHALDADEALDAVWLIYSFLDRFGTAVEAVASGAHSFAEAVTALGD